MHTLAMILAGGAGSRLSVLTQKRTKPAVPFAGKYRIIDFALSNCANSGIYTIGICTQYRPRSLNDHIQSGYLWDLDRVSGGVTLLQPYIGRSGTSRPGESARLEQSAWYQGTADAIYQNLDFIQRHHPDVVLILAGDHIYKMDYDVLVTSHRETGADLTIATLRVDAEDAPRFGILETDDAHRVISFEEKPARPKGNRASMGIYVFNADVLYNILAADHAHPKSRHDFGKDIIPKMIAAQYTREQSMRPYRVYAFPHHGYWVDVGTIEAYWQAHMDLLLDKPPFDLLDRDWIIHTRSEERPPVNMRGGAVVSNSLVTDGCVIAGAVENSVLSPGVIVREGAVVRHSILMTDAVVEKNAAVDYAILDKRVRVGAGARVGSGNERDPDPTADLKRGLTVVGKNTVVPPRARIGRNCVVAADVKADEWKDDRLPSGTTFGNVDE
ncbi:MAG: glucose-1-phosphate adenylyltransferase [Anaerolineae bacterium]|nr:glucose-1-phosphate adenylyltransferase [Anaerolineae bacterium]